MKMQLLDDLIEAVKENDAPVKDVRVGISWTGVDAKYCGVAKTYGVPFKHGNYTRDMGRLTEKTSLELVEYARSWNMVEASIGVAALNAMVTPCGKTNVNAMDLATELGKNKKIVMVGMFPMYEALREIAKEFYVLEADPSLIDPREGIISEQAAESVIPGSDVMIVTGSTLINKSLERFLRLAREASAYTIVMGPSTPMCDVLFDYGASMLAGVEIAKPVNVLKKISQSGGMINSKVCKGEVIYRTLER